MCTKCDCWIEEKDVWGTTRAVCRGTKEQEVCQCNGDYIYCDFYPQRRVEGRAKTIEEYGIKDTPISAAKLADRLLHFHVQPYVLLGIAEEQNNVDC